MILRLSEHEILNLNNIHRVRYFPATAKDEAEVHLYFVGARDLDQGFVYRGKDAEKLWGVLLIDGAFS